MKSHEFFLVEVFCTTASSTGNESSWKEIGWLRKTQTFESKFSNFDSNINDSISHKSIPKLNLSRITIWITIWNDIKNNFVRSAAYIKYFNILKNRVK